MFLEVYLNTNYFANVYHCSYLDSIVRRGRDDNLHFTRLDDKIRVLRLFARSGARATRLDQTEGGCVAMPRDVGLSSRNFQTLSNSSSQQRTVFHSLDRTNYSKGVSPCVAVVHVGFPRGNEPSVHEALWVWKWTELKYVVSISFASFISINFSLMLPWV